MRVVAASDSTSERVDIQQAAHALGMACDAGDFLTLPARLASGPASLVLLGIGLDASAVLAAIHTAAAQTGAPIYVACDDPNYGELPRLLRAGARGYIRRHELQSDLFDVVHELRTSGTYSLRTGQMIVIAGGQPGVGVTTVATNLAFAVAADNVGRVALAQFSDGVADLAVNLDIAPPHGLCEIAAAWYRLDTAVLNNCLIHHSGGVSVLADEAPAGSTVTWTPAAMRHVLVLLRSQFDFVVVDLGHKLDAARTMAMRLADAVSVVTRLDVPAVRLTKDYVERLQAAGVDGNKLVAVVNRYGQNQQLAWKPARETLGLSRFDRIADDPDRANEALNNALPLVHLGAATPVAQDYAALAARWTRGPAERIPQRLGA